MTSGYRVVLTFNLIQRNCDLVQKASDVDNMTGLARALMFESCPSVDTLLHDSNAQRMSHECSKGIELHLNQQFTNRWLVPQYNWNLNRVARADSPR